MNEMHTTTTRRGSGRRLKVVAIVGVVIAALASLTAPASARWIRGFSDVNTAGDDIAVCEDTITLEAEITHQKDSFENRFPDYVGVLDTTIYPGTSTNPAQIPLYTTYTDAITQSNEIATVEIQHYDRGFDPAQNSYVFTGQGTIPTPAGFENGDYIHTWGYDPATQNIQVIAFEIGNPDRYDCPPSALPWAIFSFPQANVGTVGALLPHTIIFDAREVDPQSLVLTNGNAATRDVKYLGAFGPFGFAQVELAEVGFDCDDEKLLLTGSDSEGYEYAQAIRVTPAGQPCIRF